MLRNILKLTVNSNKNLLKHFAQIKHLATEQEPRETEAVSAEAKHNKRTIEVLGKYNDQDGEKILKLINNYTLRELLIYDISKPRANKLLAHRMRNGLLKNLNDIFFIEGFSIKVVDKFYKSLLGEPQTSANDMYKRVKTSSFITPSMEAELRTSVSTCIAVRIGVNSITWSKLELTPNDPCQLTNWQHHEISEKKLHLNDLIQRCLYICHQIPTADCYLFENPQMAQASKNPGSVEQQNINIQKAQVTAMMGYALSARHIPNEYPLHDDKEDTKKLFNRPVVFYVKRFLAARLFNHLVGTERISSEDTMLDLMRTHYNSEDMQDFDLNDMEETEQVKSSTSAVKKTLNNIRGNVHFPMDLREMFAKAPRYHREFLGQALLLNLTFVRLVLLQDEKSIEQVTRGGRNKSANSEEL